MQFGRPVSLSTLTTMAIEVATPERNTSLNFPEVRERIVIGNTANMEKGQPRSTPQAATETARQGLPNSKSADERVTAYIEKELGKKPGQSRSSVDK